MHRLLITCMILMSQGSHAQDFVLPIGGTPFEDWTIVNYLDLDSSSNVIDFRGGAYSYDGHNAIDFTLPNFAAMDAGISVNATASGIVVDVRDGEYDRWSRVNPNPGIPANFVSIRHPNDVITEYLHLKRNSVTVSIGDSVQQGQKIGEVGSSGYSSDAHLHFVVYDFRNGFEAVETYQNQDYWWRNPLPYAGDIVGTLDHGITDHFPSTAELVERPGDVGSFNVQNESQSVYSWVNLFGVNLGDSLVYEIKDPNGATQYNYNFSPNQIRYGWWIVSANIPQDSLEGRWTIEARVNGNLLFTDNFTVENSSLVCDGKAVTVNIGLGQLPTSGDDVILGTNNADTINAVAGDDTICALAGNDVVNGGGGSDKIFGGAGDDLLNGQGQVDYIYGQGGDDRINGGVDNDYLFGGSGDDDIRGQSGNDTLEGEGGVDQFFGGSGNDTIDVGTGGNRGTAQVIRGGGNNDTIIGSNDDDDIEGGPGLDHIFGRDGDDRIRGNNARDELFGEGGNDQIEGGGSPDLLYGGDGNDLLIGGVGDDMLFGQSGDDILDGQGNTDLCDGGVQGEIVGDRLRLAFTCESIVNIP